MIFNLSKPLASLPKFSYTGTYTIADEGDGNWRIKFLTSGTLIFTKLKGSIDLFLVGGGGGGSGSLTDWQGVLYGGSAGKGGYSTTVKSLSAASNTSYSIVIGGGGSGGGTSGSSWYPGSAGGSSSALGKTANGGGNQYNSGGTATTEFGDTPGTSYSGVGAVLANSGRGGSNRGGSGYGIAGSSGIVVIRNQRE